MYPSPKIYTAERSYTLRKFIEGLGADVLYAYDRHVLGVLVNGSRLSVLPWDVISPMVPVFAPSGTMISSWVPVADRTSVLWRALSKLTLLA